MNKQIPKSSGGGCGKLVIGCGIVLLIVVILLAAGGWYVAKHWRSWVASGVALPANKAVEQSNMTDEQKQLVKERIDYLKQEFADGRLTADRIGRAIDSLDFNAIAAAGVAQYVGSGLIGSSELSDDDKAVGKQAFNRVATGVLDGQITRQQVEQVLAPIMQETGPGQTQLKSNPTAEELLQLVDGAIDLADKAGIPRDAEEVDFAKRVSEAFDEALGTP